MQEQTLNDLYLQYINGKLKRSLFEGLIYRYFLKNQEKTCISHWKRHDYEDFISCFYKSIKKAVTSYKDVGSSFEAYIHKFLLISSKEYRVRITADSITEYSTWGARVPDLYVYEEAPLYNFGNNSELLSKLLNEKGRGNNRRILALILKCYYYVSEDFLEKIAPKIGIEKKELMGMIDKIREIRQKKDDEIYDMKERIYSQYYRCIVLEKRLSYIETNTASYAKLSGKLKKAKSRLEKMRERITLIRTEATNSQVAEVIGIKKGTVDASLFKLKAKLNRIADNN